MPDLPPAKWLALVCLVLAVISACVAIYAAQISMTDSLDAMTEDENRIAFWNTISGSLNGVSGAGFLVAFWLENFR